MRPKLNLKDKSQMSTPNEYTDNFKSNSTCIFLSVRTKLKKNTLPSDTVQHSRYTSFQTTYLFTFGSPHTCTILVPSTMVMMDKFFYEKFKVVFYPLSGQICDKIDQCVSAYTLTRNCMLAFVIPFHQFTYAISQEIYNFHPFHDTYHAKYSSNLGIQKRKHKEKHHLFHPAPQIKNFNRASL